MARPLTVTEFGTVPFSTTVTEFAGSSIDTQGTGNYLKVTADSLLNWGTSDFTIEMWISLTDFWDDDQVIFWQDTGIRIIGEPFSGGLGGGGVALYAYASNTGDDETLLGVIFLNQFFSTQNFTHIGVIRQGNNFSIIYNGGSAISVTYTGDHTSVSDIYIGADSSGNNGFQGYIDELRISTVARYDVDSAGVFNYSVPTAPFVDDDDTVLLLHFNGNFLDDVRVSLDEITPSFQLTVSAVDNPSIIRIDDDTNYTWDGTDEWDRISWIDRWWQGYRFPTITTELSADALSLERAQVSIDAEFALEISADVVVLGETQLESQFTQTVEAGIITLGAAELESVASQTVSANITVTGTANLEVTAEITTTGRILKLVDILFDPFATLEVDAVVDVTGRSDLTGVFDLEVDSAITRTAACTLESTANLEVAALKLVRGTAELPTQATIEVEGLRITTAEATLDSEFTQITTARLFPGGKATLDSSFNIDIDADNLNISAALLAFEARLESGSSVQVDGKIVIADLMSFTVSADNFNIASANLSSEFTLICDVFNFRPGQAELPIVAELTAEPKLTLGGKITLDAFASQLTVGERLPGGSANLQMRFDFVSEGDLVLFDSELVYNVLPESRSITVEGETRLYRILPEDRSQTVLGETRTYRILPESRILTLEDQGA